MRKYLALVVLLFGCAAQPLPMDDVPAIEATPAGPCGVLGGRCCTPAESALPCERATLGCNEADVCQICNNPNSSGYCLE